MKHAQWLRIVFFALLAIGLFQCLYYYPRLPERVSIHFSVSGQPDGWGSREFLVIIDGALYLFIYFLFYYIRKMPAKYINMPNRSYWFVPERAEQTRKVIGLYLDAVGSLTLLLIIYLAENVYRYNIHPAGSAIPNFMTALLTYMVLVVGSSIWFYQYFSHVKKKET